ncbi:MAG: hypothetical protein CMP59_01485 [Flavobacteriales bacterium]|nr:hypothetical protein [Flavobacteriales bacterium]
MKVLLSAIIILFSATTIIAQEEDKGMKIEFKISVIQTPDSLLLNCEEGCNWQKLAFSYQEGDIFMLDQKGGGAVSYNKDGTINYEKDLKFSFTIQPANMLIEMQGLEGTNWVKTSITTSNVNPVFIDNYGVSN